MLKKFSTCSSSITVSDLSSRIIRCLTPLIFLYFSDFVDVNIGYEFVNILYRNIDGSLGVDTDLINDVREQSGGGGEPLIAG